MQVANAEPSSEQRKVAPASPVNEKLAVVALVGFAGNAVIVGGAGGVVSTVHVKLVGELKFPAASFACTVKVCEVLARPV